MAIRCSNHEGFNRQQYSIICSIGAYRASQHHKQQDNSREDLLQLNRSQMPDLRTGRSPCVGCQKLHTSHLCLLLSLLYSVLFCLELVIQGTSRAGSQWQVMRSGVSSLVGGVASMKPDSVEAQGEKLPDDGPQGTPRCQQQLNKNP